MEKRFSFQTAKSIVFGRSESNELGSYVRRLHGKKIAIVTDKGVLRAGIVEKPIKRLKSEGMRVTIFDEVPPEVPIEGVLECVNSLRGQQIDLIVGIGGGSSIDTAKLAALILKHKGKIEDYVGVDRVPGPVLPTIMLPTTAGTGAEVTPNAIVTDTTAKLKRGVVSRYLLPKIAIIDPSLTDSLPSRITAYTGVDTFTHALESYVSLNASPLTDIIALEAMKLVNQNLKIAVKDGTNKEARDNLALASMLGGMALTGAGTGGIHALAYPLGGQFAIPHGLANAIMLTYVVRFNVSAAKEKFARVAEVMGKQTGGLSQTQSADKAVEAIQELIGEVGIPTKLREFGVRKNHIPDLVKSASQVTRLLSNNPREMRVNDIEDVYHEAL